MWYYYITMFDEAQILISTTERRLPDALWAYLVPMHDADWVEFIICRVVMN